VEDGQILVVVPEVGLTLRDSPMGDRTSVFQHGTFLRQNGETVTAFDGSQWVPVSGSDVNDQPVSGYVYAGYTRPHDSSLGAMDETGRTNPALGYQRYHEITVKDGDNLWDLARKHDVSFEQMVELNQDHLISPDLIFAGDTVYLPGTAKGPLQSTVVETPDTTSTATKSSGTSSPVERSPTPDETIQPDPAGTDVRADRQSTDEILQQYQVADDIKLPEWRLEVKVGPLTIERVPFTNIEIPPLHNKTKTETDLIQQLYDREGIFAVKTFRDIVDPDGSSQTINAYRVADQYFPHTDADANPIVGAEDGHNDAFRHAFFNAMLTKEFGVGFASSFGTAHEGVPGNEADREAMDLYNNELGRRIAVENPQASPQQLAALIHTAIMNGEAIVIDSQGELVYSDQVAVGQTGMADDIPRNGVLTTPEWANTGSN
jgi:hypothetical protein